MPSCVTSLADYKSINIVSISVYWSGINDRYSDLTCYRNDWYVIRINHDAGFRRTRYNYTSMMTWRYNSSSVDD